MKSFLILLGMLFSYNTIAQEYDSQCKNTSDGSLMLIDFKSPTKLVLREDYFGVSDFSSKVTLKKSEISDRGKSTFQYLAADKELIISHPEDAINNFDPATKGFELEVKLMKDGNSQKPQKFLCRLYR